MALNMSRHIELLKVYLDAYDNPESMKKRMEALETCLAIKPSEEGFPTRSHIMMEVSFMVKQKQKVMDAVSEVRYMDAFQRAVKFLEKNPEPSKKKVKKSFEGFTGSTYTMPFFEYRTSPSTWFVHEPSVVAAPTPAPVPSETRRSEPASQSYDWGTDDSVSWDSISSHEPEHSLEEGLPIHNEAAARQARTSQETATPAPAAATPQLRSHSEILRDLTEALQAGGHPAPRPGSATASIIEAMAGQEATLQERINDLREAVEGLEVEAAARARAGSED